MSVVINVEAGTVTLWQFYGNALFAGDLAALAEMVSMGSYDEPNIIATARPIEAGFNSYDAWWKVYFKDPVRTIRNIKVWRSSAGAADGSALPSGLTMKAKSGYELDMTYTTPSISSLVASEMPTTEATALNIGPASVSEGGFSYYSQTQAQSTVAAEIGVHNYYWTIEFDEFYV